MIDQNKQENKRPVVKISDHRLITGKLHVFDWLSDVPESKVCPEIVEVRFKNTRKGFYFNHAKLNLKAGDIVAVEANPGHDIGIISLTGDLVLEQMRKLGVDKDSELKKVYRKAKPHDIEKWQNAIALEHETMIKSRQISADLDLNMKIGDVEYQGDKTKAIFYYIADERVDFRQLIKVLAETFRIRIEMRQIGARQEAGRIGGIGPCGRKLCCSGWITNFVSVTTSAARYQEISLNPQKLAGQCGKLKCCLNYEVDCYIDAQKDFPSTTIPLNTSDGLLYHQKTDIFKRIMSYSYDREGNGAFVQIPVDKVKEIIKLNSKGKVIDKAKIEYENVQTEATYSDVVGQDSLNRFDDKDEKPQRRRHKRSVRAKRHTKTISDKNGNQDKRVENKRTDRRRSDDRKTDNRPTPRKRAEVRKKRDNNQK
jgi:cell fate regulator YaaT (PSP1 superfamily)